MIITEEHDKLLAELKEKIYPWRKLLIAVDGITGVGKSGLSRYLAWKLDMPSIETDMYRIASDTQPSYRLDELNGVIQARYELDRPVIVEGIFLLDTLKKLSLEHDYIIYVRNSKADCGFALRESLPKYQEEYSPEDKADYVFCTDFKNN